MATNSAPFPARGSRPWDDHLKAYIDTGDAEQIENMTAEDLAFSPVPGIPATDVQTAIQQTAGSADPALTDTQVSGFVAGPSQTATILDSVYATRRLGLAPGAATLKATARGSTPIPLDTFGGYLWGVGGGSIQRSANDGVTWTSYCPTPSGGTPLRLIPTDDGEMISASPTHIQKSTGWSTGTPTWTTKVTANGEARFTAFQVDGNGTKFICAQYGPASSAGSQPYIDSRYAHISVDRGTTWTQVWDSVAKFGATEANMSHLHGACYDPWSDRFYLAEGHGATRLAISGVYVSSNNGTTWVRPTGLINQPPPTVMIPTDDGIVCGSDHELAGVWGIVRQPNPQDEVLTRTWAWTSGVDGVIGFGQRGFRDPATGVVYIGFFTSNVNVPPIIAGGTASAAGLAWTWDGANSVGSQVHQVAVSNGILLGHGTFNGSQYILRGLLPGATGGTPLDTGNISGGAASGTSVAVGPGASSEGIGLGNVVMGVGATVAGNSSNQTAVGRYASTTATGCTAYGRNASAHTGTSTAVGEMATAAGGSTALGQLANASGAQSLAVGRGSVAEGTYSTAIGVTAKAPDTSTHYATAVGRLAEASGSYATAVGEQATAVGGATALGQSAIAAGTQSLAVGRGSEAMGTYATVIGAFAKASALSSIHSTAVGRTAEAATNATTVGSASKATMANATALGYLAAATHNNSTAIGAGVTTTVAAQLAIGDVHMEIRSISPPGNPAVGAARLYVRTPTGTGKPELCVKFADGATHILAVMA